MGRAPRPTSLLWRAREASPGPAFIGWQRPPFKQRQVKSRLLLLFETFIFRLSAKISVDISLKVLALYWLEI